MIERERVADIVNARLPEAELVDALKQLAAQPLPVEVMRLFIEETRKTVVGKDLLPSGAGLLDVAGTGGSGFAHFNTSTFCAFVLAAGGAKVAKFGNRASRSGAGSADLLEALGFPLDLPAGKVKGVIEQAGVAFLFAPHYYPGLKKLASARKAVGRPTIFNHIGPLLNPVEPQYRVFGMSSQALTLCAVDYLKEAHSGRALVVSSQLGLDELMPGAFNHVLLINDGSVQDLSFVGPGAAMFQGNDGKQLRFDLQHNIDIFKQLVEIRLKSEPQPWLDLVCLNAGAGFFVSGISSSITDGVELAKELIAGGRVKEKFDEVRRVYEKCAA